MCFVFGSEKSIGFSRAIRNTTFCFHKSSIKEAEDTENHYYLSELSHIWFSLSDSCFNYVVKSGWKVKEKANKRCSALKKAVLSWGCLFAKIEKEAKNTAFRFIADRNYVTRKAFGRLLIERYRNEYNIEYEFLLLRVWVSMLWKKYTNWFFISIFISHVSLGSTRTQFPFLLDIRWKFKPWSLSILSPISLIDFSLRRRFSSKKDFPPQD